MSLIKLPKLHDTTLSLEWVCEQFEAYPKTEPNKKKKVKSCSLSAAMDKACVVHSNRASEMVFVFQEEMNPNNAVPTLMTVQKLSRTCLGSCYCGKGQFLAPVHQKHVSCPPAS